jgi:lipopolysaccharide transport system permease protein
LNQEKIISAEPDTLTTYFSKLWRYRDLITTFARRELKIKYAQTFFGVFWILLQPLPSVLIFTFFFGYLIKADTGRLPYPVFALTGMIGWSYFTYLATGIGNSLVESQSLLKKVFFPKLIIPFSKVLVGAVDFMVGFALIIVAMFLFRVYPDWTIVFLPLFLFFNMLTGLCVGIWIAAFTFRYRDVQHIAPYIINFSIWLTPVFYPTTILPKQFSMWMYLNPMAFVIEGYRCTLAGDKMPSVYFLLSVIPVIILLVSGLWYFKKIEDDIADFI